MSSIVAVAGGTGSLGRAIVEALVSNGKFEVLVLAREVSHCVYNARSIAYTSLIGQRSSIAKIWCESDCH